MLHGEDAYSTELAVSVRYAGIAEKLYQQYWMYVCPEKDKAMMPIQLTDEESITAFLDSVKTNEFAESFSTMEIVGKVDILDLCKDYEDEKTTALLQKSQIWSGCDDIQESAMHLKLEGEDYLLFIQSGK